MKEALHVKAGCGRVQGGGGEFTKVTVCGARKAWLKCGVQPEGVNVLEEYAALGGRSGIAMDL